MKNRLEVVDHRLVKLTLRRIMSQRVRLRVLDGVPAGVHEVAHHVGAGHAHPLPARAPPGEELAREVQDLHLVAKGPQASASDLREGDTAVLPVVAPQYDVSPLAVPGELVELGPDLLADLVDNPAGGPGIDRRDEPLDGTRAARAPLRALGQGAVGDFGTVDPAGPPPVGLHQMVGLPGHGHGDQPDLGLVGQLAVMRVDLHDVALLELRHLAGATDRVSANPRVQRLQPGNA